MRGVGMTTTTAFEFSAAGLGGGVQQLLTYSGKVLLIVNTASECGLTPQYRQLEDLYETYADRGLVILGFPCNQFGGQEPGDAKQIASFCSTQYGVRFPMFDKIEVNGPNTHPLYVWLKAQAADPDGSVDITWNFAKFLVGRDGQVRRRYGPAVKPFDLVEDIEMALTV